MRDGSGTERPREVAHRRHLEQAPKFADLVELGIREFDDAVALVGHGRDDSLIDEVEHRLAHGGRGNPELLGQCGHGVGHAGDHAPRDEGCAQGYGNPLAQAQSLAE